jgi:hypothetical protein
VSRARLVCHFAGLACFGFSVVDLVLATVVPVRYDFAALGFGLFLVHLARLS